MGSIRKVFVERVMTERLVSGINVWYVKVHDIESKRIHCVITTEEVSPKFNIDIKNVKYILRVTTRKVIRNAVHPLKLRYQVHHMNLNRKRLNAQLYTDHLMAKTKSLEGNM